VTTHTSGSAAGKTTSGARTPATGIAPAAATKPVATRTSGASTKTGTGAATGTTAKPVTTRTSGKGGEKGDSHDN
jgi:hypothetical protein